MLQYLLQQQNSWHSGNFVGQRGKGQCALTSFVPTRPYCKEGSALRLYDAIGTGLRRQTFIVKRSFSLNSHTLNASIVRSSLAIFQLHVLTNDRAGTPGVPYSCAGFTGCISTCSSHVNVCVWNFQLIMTATPPLSHCWTWGLTSATPSLSSPRVEDATSQAVAATYEGELEAEMIGKGGAERCMRGG